MQPYRVFFSHGSDDKYVVANLLKPKVEATGAKVFLDAGEIEYGDDFRRKILDELAICDELLVLFTRSSLRRPWVLAEVGAILVRNKRIVAIRYGPSESELQELGILSLLGTNNLLNLTDEDVDKYLSQLSDRVENHNA
ncbi:toll/interleukin-1 receptor domain-containing protein [Leptolyngbya iicbica]|uniref:Toll/interleukin-1 receptor domain-containing protein n=2 Tax=Cyanophyceae TaxID=3028117 RepID=A0A4Q7EG05_9CYAN|nr:toll/interleukin-1 receptor domain-containing protein [Leptolyngbya sp. LK]RZM81976.1 toll/interleukin-1 receptor domain-containing protein [Leptolyngbya sp. LK]